MAWNRIKGSGERCNWCINQRRTDTSIKLKNCPLIPTLMPLYPAQDWDNSRWTVWPIRPKVFMVVSILLESLMPSEVMRQKPQPWKSNISHYPWLTGSLWLQWGAVPASWSLLSLADVFMDPWCRDSIGTVEDHVSGGLDWTNGSRPLHMVSMTATAALIHSKKGFVT